MADSSRVRCNSLDTGLGCEKELMNRDDYESMYSEEPSAAELAQCEAEVRMLLSIIAEVNKKMGSLKAPSDAGDLRPPRPTSPLFPDLLSHRQVRGGPERNSFSSKRSTADGGGGSVVWSKLQDAISAVEDSIQCRRTWAAPLSSSDRDKPREHLSAAHDSWTKASQILEDMEREFGISCPSLPKLLPEEGSTQDTRCRSSSQSQQGEPGSGVLDDECSKLAGHHRAWRSGSVSPSYRRVVVPLSPDWTSQSVPGSPLILRRSARGATPSSVEAGVSSTGSLHSASPCLSTTNPDGEIERLTRYVEKLKCRNERLTASVERKRAESDQLLVTVRRLESDCSALQAALRYCGKSEEVYDELLTLYDAKKQCGGLHSAEEDPDGQQTDSPSVHVRQMGTDEISTSFSTAGGAEETSLNRSPQSADREVFLLQQLDRLKEERAALCLPKPNMAAVDDHMSSDCGSRQGSRFTQELTRPTEGKREKLVCELVSAREEMSDLRALVRLKEKELRCLEWTLMAQKGTGASGALEQENQGEEQDGRRTEQQWLYEGRPNLALQAVLHREHVLKKRTALMHDSDAANRYYGEDQIARLTHAHSKALNSYRHIRRKYREHVWRLEQKVATMVESQRTQCESPKSEEAEWRREETVL